MSRPQSAARRPQSAAAGWRPQSAARRPQSAASRRPQSASAGRPQSAASTSSSRPGSALSTQAPRLSYRDVIPIMDAVARRCPHAVLRRQVLDAAMMGLAADQPDDPVDYVLQLLAAPETVARRPMHRPRSAPTAQRQRWTPSMIARQQAEAAELKREEERRRAAEAAAAAAEAEAARAAAEEEAAATKIAAMQRGKQTRREMKDPVAKELRRARKKFNQLDKDGSGALDGDEMHELALWVFSSFHPGDEPLPPERREKEAAKLKKRLDKDGDGTLDFEEFAAWFKRTCEGIQRFRKGKAEQERAARGIQARQRGKAARKQVAELRGKRIEEELGLTGSEEEAAAIARMQAAERGRQSRLQVAEMREQAATAAAPETATAEGGAE